MIMLGEADTVVAGGMENSVSTAVLRGTRHINRLGRPPRNDSTLDKDMEDYLFTNLLTNIEQPWHKQAMNFAGEWM